MHYLFFLLSFIASVLAFDIPVGDRVFKTSEILAIPDSPVKAACAANCTIARTRIEACNDQTACLCRADTFASVVNCETCMFHYLIATNTVASDPRVGSNVVVGGYVAGCATANPNLSPAGLPLPANWNGLVVSVLPVGGAVVAVIFGAIMGMSAIFLLSNM